MSRKAEAAEPPSSSPTHYDEQTLIDMLKWTREKRLQLKDHPESPDYQVTWQFEQHLERRLREIAWNKYKAEKGLE